MKKLILLFSIISSSVLYSQSLKVTYSEKRLISQERLDAMPESYREATLAQLKVPNMYILEYNEGVSLYKKILNTKGFEYEKNITPNESDGIDEGKIIVSKKFTEYFYYKDLINNLLLFKLNNGGLDFDGKDELIKWSWEITKEKKLISGYNCKKAISRVFNGYFVAWFTEDIPVNAGPEKYDGLPGVILYVSNSGQEFIAEKIEILDEKININTPQIPSNTVTLAEMYDAASKQFKVDKNFKLIKEGNKTTQKKVF